MDDKPTPLSGLPENEQTARLRAALTRQADSYQPSDRCAQIWDAIETEHTERQGGRSRFRWLAVAVVAMIALGVAVPVLSLRLRDQRVPTTTATVATTVNDESTAAAEGADSSLPTVIRGVPVYYFGPSGQLHREFRDLPTQTDKLTTAVAAVLNVAPADPDFSSAWPGGQANSARVDGQVITLDLSASAFGQFTSREQVLTAIDQVVYTATAAVGDASGHRSVRILEDGNVNLPILGKPAADFTRSGLGKLAPLWFNAPSSGETVPAGVVTLTGQVQSSLQPAEPVIMVSSAGGSQRTVIKGLLTLDPAVEGWQMWQFEVTLAPGDYEVVVEVVVDSQHGMGRLLTLQRTFSVR